MAAEAFADEARPRDRPAGVCTLQRKGHDHGLSPKTPLTYTLASSVHCCSSSGVLLSALLGLSHAQLTLDGSLGPQRTLTGPDYRIVLPWGRSGRQSIS